MYMNIQLKSDKLYSGIKWSHVKAYSLGLNEKVAFKNQLFQINPKGYFIIKNIVIPEKKIFAGKQYTKKGYREIVKLLLKQPDINVDINIKIKDNQRFIALMCAPEHEHSEVENYLIDYAVKNGNKNITYSINIKHKDVIELLLHPKQLEKENISNNSIKIEYSLSKDYKKLTIRGGDFNSNNSESWIILIHAMKYTDLEIIQEILNKKDLNGNRLVDINVKSKYKNTALTIGNIGELYKKKPKPKPKPRKSIDERFWKRYLKGDHDNMDLLLEEKDVNIKIHINKKKKQIRKCRSDGGGQPKPPKAELKGPYSKKIDKGNRLVFEGDPTDLLGLGRNYNFTFIKQT
ncbi:hypothetical protein U3516DRAFT_781729 [Neocallimastix sp. 'constans']